MKNKNLVIVSSLVVVGLFAFLLLGGQSAQGVIQSVVQLPEQLQTIITGLIMAGVAWLFTQLFTAVPWLEKFLGQYVDEVGAFLSVTILGVIQDYLNLIPPNWEGVGNLALSIILEILIVVGFFKVGRQLSRTYSSVSARLTGERR